MISENLFDDNDFRALDAADLEAEMAVINEWVVRDWSDPDDLKIVYLRPVEDGTIDAACSCDKGSRDKKCLHALYVINQIKDQTWLLQELFKRRDNVVAA